MYKDEIRDIVPLTMEHIVKIAQGLLPPQYSNSPWNYPELQRGVALLKSEDGLNAYLAAYGYAHTEKAIEALKRLPFNDFNAPIEVFDWGCGQGLASVCLIQEFAKHNMLANLKEFHLVEPSSAALDRAKLNVAQALPAASIDCVNKGLPADRKLPFECVSEINVKRPIAIHLFSNILDLETIDLKALAELISQSGGRHYVLCIGPAARNEDRINSFCRYFNPEAVQFFFNFRDYEFRKSQYNNHTFGCFIRCFRFDLSSETPVLIPYKFFPSKRFFAAYQSDMGFNLDIRPTEENEIAFEVLAPFDIGASVFDDVDPILAVLSNLISRGLPTKASPFIERLFSEHFGVSNEESNLGSIHFKYNPKNDNDCKSELIFRFVTINVARLEKTIIEAMLSGHISLEQPIWNVLVKESDNIPCAAIAFAEVAQMYNHLCALSRDYSDRRFPKVELTIVNELNPEHPLHLGNKAFKESNPLLSRVEYDIVVDISGDETSKPMDVEFSEFKAKNKCYFNVRASEYVLAKGEIPERYIYTTDRIVYKPLTKLNQQGTHDIIEENVEHLRYFLQMLFRKNDFREGQLPIISRALQLKSVIGLLPTGGGKSLTYQISALLQPGVSVIVDPLMSLMKDQYDGLLKIGIDFCTFINSSVPDKAKREGYMKDSKMLFVFLSPERLAIYRFRDSLRAMADNHVYFAYGVIDEVHCVSEWGHDFRFTYLHLGRNMYNYVRPKKSKDESLNHITLMGLTATASFDVLADVERELSGNNAFPLDPEATIRYENTNRLELQYRIVKVEDEEAHDKWDVYRAKNESVPSIVRDVFRESLKELLTPESIATIKKRFIERENINSESQLAKRITEADLYTDVSPDWYFKSDDESSAIIFCPHRAGTLGVHNSKSLGVAGQIRESLDITNVSEFVGGDDPKAQDDFIQGKTNIMVATKAFGMGIDKPHVRFTLNMNHSGSLEAFVQEAGRAGRDKKMALAVILYSDRVFNEQDEFTRIYEPVAVDYGVHKFFYDGNFLGEQTEWNVMSYLMNHQQAVTTEADSETRINKTITGFLKKLNEAEDGQAIVTYISYKYPSRDAETLDGFLRQQHLRTIITAPRYPGEDTAKLQALNQEQYQASLMKAIYRMCCIGLIEDFTQDYINSEFRIVTRKNLLESIMKASGTFFSGTITKNVQPHK